MKIFLALLHYPVYDKNKNLVVTSITNTDLHDLSRLAKTFNMSGFFVVTPLKTQVELCHRLVKHWVEGYGATFNTTRKHAIQLLSVVSSYNCLIGHVMANTGEKPVVIATSAKKYPGNVSYSHVRKIINNKKKVFIILVGTGWGIHKDILDKADYVLEPVYGLEDYNHLSVRCASAIILDRLLNREHC